MTVHKKLGHNVGRKSDWGSLCGLDGSVLVHHDRKYSAMLADAKERGIDGSFEAKALHWQHVTCPTCLAMRGVTNRKMRDRLHPTTSEPAS